MGEQFDFKKLGSGAKKALWTTLKVYGTGALIKELDKNFKGDEDAQKRVKIVLETLLSLWTIFRIKMETGNERGALHEETEYEDFGGLKHYVYAGFSQLTYLNWFKADDKVENNLIGDIITDENSFKTIRSDSYNGAKGYYPEGQDYKYKMKVDDGEPFKIYDGEDKRIYFLYSENMKEPNINPKFPELQQWQFLYGFDHAKILGELKGEMLPLFPDDPNSIKVKKYAKISYTSSDFQASVFKHESSRKVMIAYRGTDPTHLSDWLPTNAMLGTKMVPDALTCAVWVYEKVATDPDLAGYEIHVTGHSMGGALSQYIAVYGYRPTLPTVFEGVIKDAKGNQVLTRPVHKTVTFNGLGIAKQWKIVVNNHKEAHYNVFKRNFFPFMNDENKVLNFYMQNDGVSDIQIGVGKSVMVDTIIPEKTTNLQIKIFGNDMAGYHSVSAFLPFIHNGNIVRNKLARNHMLNSIKQAILLEKKAPMKALLGSKEGNGGKANTFMSSSLKDFTNKKVVTDKNKIIETPSGYIEVKPEKSDYLYEEFEIESIGDDTALGKIYDAMTDKKESNGNIFYYLTPYNCEREKSDWYVYDKNKGIAAIGSFNNAVGIVGVEGGAPLQIELSKEVAPTSKELEKREENFYVRYLQADSVSGFKFISYSKFIMTQEIGKHNAFVIEGRISEEEYEKCKKSKYQDKEINISPFNIKENNSDMDKSVLMRGIIKRVEFRKESPVDYFIKINGVSKSYLLNKKKRNKSFFNKEKTYKDLFDEINSDYDQVEFLNNESPEKLGKCFIQYGESDWEFSKRVVSNLGVSCIVDRCETSGSNEGENSNYKQKIHLGYYDQENPTNIERVIAYDDKLVSKDSSGRIVLCLDKILRVGTYVELQVPTSVETKEEEKKEEKKPIPKYLIKRVEAKLENDAINYYYTLIPNTLDDKRISKIDNKKLAGRSLQGLVRAVNQIKDVTPDVKYNNQFISINLDLPNFDDFENSKDNSDNLEETYLFPMTVSFDSNGSGEFSSPKIGEKIMIYFPTSNEDEGVIISGIRDNHNEELHTSENLVMGIDTGQGLILNKEKGVSILGNSFSKPKDSTSMVRVKSEGVELQSQVDMIGINLNENLIKLMAKNSSIEFTSDSINFKSGGTSFKLSASGIDAGGGTLNLGDGGIKVKDLIII